jgi:hypothetical protein
MTTQIVPHDFSCEATLSAAGAKRVADRAALLSQ